MDTVVPGETRGRRTSGNGGALVRLWGERLVVSALLLVFVALGAYYALSSPLYSRPDEPVHYAFTMHLRDGKGLPVVDMSYVGSRNDKPEQMEAHQPPLYYAAVAALAPAGPDPAVEMNPYFFHTPEEKRQLWLTTYVNSPLEAPAFFTGRLLSVLCGAAAVLFAYLFVRLFLTWPLAALSAGLMAFTPQFVFIASSFSNDMPLTALCHLGLWQTGVAWQRGLTLRRGLVLGLVIALATLTKIGGLGLLGPVGLIALWQARRERTLAPLLAGVLCGLTVLIVDGWWFWRNLELYGNPLATNSLPVLLGPVTGPLPWERLTSHLVWVWQSFWLDFGPAGYVLAEPVLYWGLALVFLLALFGLARTLKRERRARPLFALAWGWFAIVFVAMMAITVREGIIMGGGRLLLPAAVAVSATLAVGLTGLPRLGPRAMSLGVTALLVLAILAPGRYQDPRYPEFAVLTAAEPAMIYTSGVRFGDDAFVLLGYDLRLNEEADGAQFLDVTYYWRALAGSTKNLSLFLQLIDRTATPQVIRAHYENLPTLGAYPTSRWQEGQVVVDQVSIPLPPLGQPADGLLTTGLLDWLIREQLRAVDGAGQEIPHWCATLAEIRTTPAGEREVVAGGEVVATAPGVPSPGETMAVRFGAEQLELTGLTAPAQGKAGEALPVYLYWQAAGAMAEDYVVSLQLVDPAGNLAAQADAQPLDGHHPTSRWTPGEQVVDSRVLALPAALAPDAYELRAIVYRQPSLERLPVSGGPGGPDYALLGRIEITP